jgi:hypothetical protein
MTHMNGNAGHDMMMRNGVIALLVVAALVIGALVFFKGCPYGKKMMEKDNKAAPAAPAEPMK